MKKRTILLLSILILLTVKNTEAQVVYTDLQDTVISYPGIPVAGDSTRLYSLDINSDNIFDCIFILNIDEDAHQESYIICSISNRVVYIENSGYLCTKVLEEGYSIEQGSDWNPYNESGIRLDRFGSVISCDIPFQDKYYGFSFEINSKTHYGWLYLDVNNIGELVLHGCAYNTIPEEAILTDHTVGIKNVEIDDRLVVYFANGGLQINEKSGRDLIKHVEVVNLSGQTVFERITNSYSVSFNLFDIPASLYIVRITFENTVESRLIYIK